MTLALVTLKTSDAVTTFVDRGYLAISYAVTCWPFFEVNAVDAASATCASDTQAAANRPREPEGI